MCVISAHSKSTTIYSALVLDKITKIKTSEKYGDEIYWVITEFKSSGKNAQHTIPHYPVHWPARALNDVKNVPLWQGKIPSGQSSIIYLELVEHDAPPFNVDDSIGSVRLVVKNEKGNLKIDWKDSENVKYNETKEGKLTFEKLRFHGEGGEYLVTMHFKQLNANQYQPIQASNNRRIRLR